MLKAQRLFFSKRTVSLYGGPKIHFAIYPMISRLLILK